ncbi:hypothetical protein [Algoriphagus yeomjeoni]|uniref:DUF3253 domain-containing protein n=1 Tax=Algoriphagus yeomjeoni TaxID=291403 RepID=A0A327PNN0_9BACT|nr:hypothetical protein [Algoriphagus yeomjeoni]RAI93798.1 hypothetical protein LV83_00704 [Algoriphagus yeomjeoni]
MEVLRTAILDKLQRNKGEIFSTAEVVMQMYPEDWELFLEEVNTTAIALQQEGLVAITSVEEATDFNFLKSKSLELSSPSKT